jgi:enoyl-[acyl-carrier protein] reductase / trans-2-enoyl-CoA reductase (NAD+)
MKLALPRFQYRFIPSMGNAIHPGNFHPVGTQVAAEAAIERALAGRQASTVPDPGAGGRWLVVGSSGGFGSAARIVLGARRGAHTLGVAYDAVPTPESSNKIRKIGSPGFHRNLAIERRLRQLGLAATSIVGDAFSDDVIQKAIVATKDELEGRLDGIVWALAAPRATHPRTGATVASALRPLGAPVTLKAFSGRDEAKGEPPRVAETELPPGTPEEAIGTIFVMGGEVVERWVNAFQQADLLADGFTLLTISYRGSPLNEGIYRKGLIGLAKADLEFRTRMLSDVLRERVAGRAITVEGPAVVTEASGGIPGVPFYMAHLQDVMGDRFEDPLDSMVRMFDDHFGARGPELDDEGLLRMDDRELAADVQAAMAKRFADAKPGDAFDDRLYDAFMRAYAATRGFDVAGVDYEAELDTDEVCAG